MQIPFHFLAVLFAGCLGVATPAADDLEALQGTWEGGVAAAKPRVGFYFEESKGLTPGVKPVPADKPREKITITINGDSFHFHRDTNFWFETTITLPENTAPRQLLATIKGAEPSQGNSVIGKVVAAIFKIEGETLTLAARGDGGEETPTKFDASDDKGLTIYELRKVQPQQENSEPPKLK